MNYCKEKLVSGLTSLIDELQCDDACREHISLLVEARDYIRELPVIYDKENRNQADCVLPLSKVQ